MPGPISEKEYLRPLMRDVLYFQGRGLGEQEIIARLEERGHRPDDVQTAYTEAQRARLFRENIEAFGAGKTLGELWDRYWLSIFTQAYGRRPTSDEESWARARPGDVLGVMVELTVEGAEGFRWTPTLNVPWDATPEEIAAQVEDWFRTSQRSPPPPGSVARVLEEGGRVDVRLIGGALVPRIEPTITLGR